jgi:membrane protease YdiL (CAAX protease family)
MILWVLPLWWINRESASSITGAQASLLYWGLRTFNSVILIAIAEELLIRGFLTEWLFQAGKRAAGLSRLWDALWRTLDEAPRKLNAVPFSAISFLGGSLFFVLGHSPKEYLPAFLYYGFTYWVYCKTRSLVIVMGIHGLVNAGIALAVRFGGWHFLWFG